MRLKDFWLRIPVLLASWMHQKCRSRRRGAAGTRDAGNAGSIDETNGAARTPESPGRKGLKYFGETGSLVLSGSTNYLLILINHWEVYYGLIID